MKRILISLLILLGVVVNAQVSQLGINYQAQIRNAAGVLIPDSSVTLRFTLLPSQFSATPVWQETDNVTTDHYGIAGTIIGLGTRTGGTATTFNQADFSVSNFWIKVEIGSGGNFTLLGNPEPFQSVPYAKVAGNTTLFPAGMIMPFAGDTAHIPSGWLLCDGREVSRSTYSTLYGAIQDAWGRGNNSTTFNLPDFRGQFLRGVSYGSGVDPDSASSVDGLDGKRYAKYNGGNIGNIVGSYQQEAFKSHNHTSPYMHNLGTLGGPSDFITSGGGLNSNATGGSETRPNNAYVNYLIKY